MAEELSELLIAGEHIHAESSVVRSAIDGKAYTAGQHAGKYIGDAVEELREGFRVAARGGEVREDDA